MANYSRNRYNYVIDSNFTPFTMQEMLVPFNAYKEAYKEAKDEYKELADETNIFKYLSSTLPEDSAARKIYEGYAKDFDPSSEDFSRNGLSLNNKRALASLRNRFQGEIGVLKEADTKLKALQKSRDDAISSGKNMRYANENPTIDDMLPGQSFNKYGINVDDVYNRGKELGKAMSSRIFSSGDAGSVLQGYYRDWRETHGISQESIAEFMNSDAVKGLVASTLSELGVTDNLTDSSFRDVQNGLLNGIYNGIVYEESNKPYKDDSKMSAKELDASARDWSSLNLTAASNGMKKDSNNNWVLDPAAIKAKEEAKSKISKTTSSSSKSSGTVHQSIGKQRLRITWDGNDPVNDEKLADNPTVSPIKDDEEYSGFLRDYDELPEYAQKIANKVIGDGNVDYYQYYFRPYNSGFFNDDEAILEIEPRGDRTDNADSDMNFGL